MGCSLKECTKGLKFAISLAQLFCSALLSNGHGNGDSSDDF